MLFSYAYHLFLKEGQLSLENNEHLLILAKSMLNMAMAMAMELDRKY